MDVSQNITIKRCPSWDKVSGLLGEWNRFKNHNGPMSPDRAARIAGELLAVSTAKRRGLPMPKDWKRVHPSQPYQMHRFFEEITAHPIITTANALPTFWIEIQKHPESTVPAR